MLVGKEYQFKLVKKLDGDKPPRITLADIVAKIDNLDKKLSGRIDKLEKVVTQDHNLLIKIIKLNNLRTE